MSLEEVTPPHTHVRRLCGSGDCDAEARREAERGCEGITRETELVTGLVTGEGTGVREGSLKRRQNRSWRDLSSTVREKLEEVGRGERKWKM